MKENIGQNKSIKMMYGYRLAVGFSLFFIFLFFYLGVAIITTPNYKEIAGIDVGGLPLGFVLSLGIFPISWILMFLYFKL